jgi:hypothetical protein
MTTLRQVKELFERDSVVRPSNRSANAPIIKLVELINNDNAGSECENNISGSCLNRGSAMECLVNIYFNKVSKAIKAYNDSRVDLVMNGKRYEVKYSSSKGYAHYNPNQNLDNLVFVDSKGIYLTSGKYIVLDKCGKHIKTINKEYAKVLVVF